VSVIKIDLEMYRKRKQLIEIYRAELDGDLTTADTVSGSMAERPYAKRRITMRGQDVVRARWLRQRVRVLGAECARTEAFVAGVADEYMGALLRWKYLEGLSWPSVRRALGERRLSVDALKKRVNKFLKNA